MENLNAEQIKKALEWCIQSDSCEYCEYKTEETVDVCSIRADALALIELQEQKIFELENRLKECENGYEGTLFLDRCKLRDAEEQVQNLRLELNSMRSAANSYKMHYEKIKEENDKLHASYTELARVHEKVKRGWESDIILRTQEKEDLIAATVRRMQSMITERCIASWIYPAFVKNTVDKVAEEMLGKEGTANLLDFSARPSQESQIEQKGGIK